MELQEEIYTKLLSIKKKIIHVLKSAKKNVTTKLPQKWNVKKIAKWLVVLIRRVKPTKYFISKPSQFSF